MLKVDIIGDPLCKANTLIIQNFLEFFGIPSRIINSSDVTIDVSSINNSHEIIAVDYRLENDKLKNALLKITVFLKTKDSEFNKIDDKVLNTLIDLYVDHQYYNHFEKLKIISSKYFNLKYIEDDLVKGILLLDKKNGNFFDQINDSKLICENDYLLHANFYLIMMFSNCHKDNIDAFNKATLAEASCTLIPKIICFSNSNKILNPLVNHLGLYFPLIVPRVGRKLANLIDFHRDEDKMQIANGYIFLGKLYKKYQANYEDVNNCYKQSIKFFPNNPMAYNYLATELEEENNELVQQKIEYFKSSIKELNKRKELSFYDIEFLINDYVNLSRLFYRNKDYSNALEYGKLALNELKSFTIPSFLFDYFLEEEREKIIHQFSYALAQKNFSRIQSLLYRCYSEYYAPLYPGEKEKIYKLEISDVIK